VLLIRFTIISYYDNLHSLMSRGLFAENSLRSVIYTAGRKAEIWQRDDQIFAVARSLFEYEAE